MYKNFGKYNQGWLKIAEFVLNGEKEKALGLYRLLGSSLNDKALLYLIEGNIYLSFNDKVNAITCYLRAINIYNSLGKYNEVYALSQHISLIKFKSK